MFRATYNTGTLNTLSCSYVLLRGDNKVFILDANQLVLAECLLLQFIGISLPEGLKDIKVKRYEGILGRGIILHV